MQISKELLQADVTNLKNELEQAKAQVNKIIGALAAVEGVLVYLEKPEEAPKGEAGNSPAEPEAPATHEVVDGRGKYNEVAK